MKIHIVQKGDTLWEISQNYGVDFEQLKQLNSHLAAPDMIMPGMKIKIPSTSKAVKKESMAGKETKKETVKHPYKDTSPKEKPVIMEDDKEKQMPVKPEMPMQTLPQMPPQPIMQMPIMEQDFNNYTTINLPQVPQYKPEVKKEVPKKEKEEIKEMVKPTPLPTPMPLPEISHQPQPMPMMVPMCCHIVHPCFPPVEFPVMGNMAGGFPPNIMPQQNLISPMEHPGMVQNMGHTMNTGAKDCGCGGGGANANYPGPQHEQFYPGYKPQQMPRNMYPPQYGQTPMSNNPFPSPPEFPGFPEHKEKDDSTSE